MYLGHRIHESQTGSGLKASSLKDFHSTKTLQAAEGGRQSAVLPSCDTYEPQWPVLQDNSTGATVVLTTWLQLIAPKLDFRPNQWEGNNAWYWKLIQLS